MTKLEMYLIAGFVLLAVIAGAYFKGHSAGAESVQVKWDKAAADQAEREQKQSAAASTKLETGNAQAKVVYRTITNTVDKVVEKPVYRNVCLESDGLLVANQALTGSLAPPRKPDAILPRPDASARRPSGIGLTQTSGSQ